MINIVIMYIPYNVHFVQIIGMRNFFGSNLRRLIRQRIIFRRRVF